MNLTELSGSLFLVIALVVPGFIIAHTKAQFLTGRVPPHKEMIIYYLTLGCINFAVFSWLIFWLLFGQLSLYWQAFLWFFVIFLGPCILGAIAAWLSQNNRGGWLYRFLQLSPIHEVPAAWDYYFLQRQPCFVLITTNDNATIAGYFGEHSFASSDPEERDIYIEQLYSIDASNNWQQAMPGKGILISSEKIKHLQFWPA